jgi:CBS domain-containing protein
VNPESELAEAIELMLDRKVGPIVVVGDNGRTALAPSAISTG